MQLTTMTTGKPYLEYVRYILSAFRFCEFPFVGVHVFMRAVGSFRVRVE